MKQFMDLNANRGNYDLSVDLCKTDRVTQVSAVPQVQGFFKLEYLKNTLTLKNSSVKKHVSRE